ncbi:MAG: hypothetical protein AAGK92_09805 [Pseudomonadota bacterium]
MGVQYQLRPAVWTALYQKACAAMDVILHLGSHRTGTTTFQSYLANNERMLKRLGIVSWRPKRLRKGMMSGLLGRPDQVTAHGFKRAQRSCGLIRMEMDRMQKLGVSHLIVSEENMIGAMRNNLREERLYPGLAARMARMREAFADSCTRIVLCVRSYDEYWASSLGYAVASGHSVPMKGQLDRLVTQPRRWRHMVTELSDAFPAAHLVVWPFEAMAGQPEKQLRLMTGTNAPLPLKGARAWHHKGQSDANLQQLVAERGEAEALAFFTGEADRWMPFDGAQQMALRAQYASDIRWLKNGADGCATFVQSPDKTEIIEENEWLADAAAERRASPTRGQIHDGQDSKARRQVG